MIKQNSGENSRLKSCPALREDLKLLRGPAGSNGEPTWTIHDPVRNRFHRISLEAYHLLSFWHMNDPEKIADAVESETGKRPCSDDIVWLVHFLRTNFLVQIITPEAVGGLQRIAKAVRSNWLYLLLTQYLFFRIPLLRPQTFLDKTWPFVSILVSRQAVASILVLGVIGLFLTARQWDGFQSTFLHFYSWQGMIWYGLALLITKVLHEFGHAYAATKFGCRVPTMGVALLVMWPVLYTDTSDAWRLTSKQQRLLIGAAGMLTELGIALLATFAWSFLPDGPARSAAFLIATVTWVMTLAINLNPFMRFDGYYLLSDVLDIPNLQDRAFAYTRWWLRETMFGFGELAPEIVSHRRSVFLVTYTVAVWLYRLVLFTGIALLVYGMFFKVLGILLFLAEIIMLIALPIIRELKEIFSRRSMAKLNKKIMITIGMGAALMVVFIYPWHSTVDVPALREAKNRQVVFAPEPSVISDISVSRGDSVSAGQVLLKLQSDSVDYAILKMEKSLEMRQVLVRREAAGGKERARINILRQDIESDQARLHALQEKQSKLTIKALIDGKIIEFNDDLRVGMAVNDKTQLATLIDPAYSQVIGYARDEDLLAIKPGTFATFFPDDYSKMPIELTVTDVSPVNAPTLPETYLASVYGGEIAVENDRNNHLIPVTSIYKVMFSLTNEAGAPVAITRGIVKLEGPGRSLAEMVFNSVASVLLREANF